MNIKKQFFSKSSKNIINLKKDFILRNNELTNQAQKWNKFYSKQPKRLFCKVCEKKLEKKIFNSHYANYTICKYCGHLNGLNQDTKQFNEFLYKKDKNKNFF